MNKIPVTIAKGDGIGPEIMQATLGILEAAGAPLEYHQVEIGEKVYLRGYKAGIEPETWDTIRKTKAFLKAPITTPQGGGFKSLNVTIRTALNLYANVRPCVAYNPYVKTKHPDMDVVIVRENEEDLYIGLEYRQTADTVYARKLISRQGCERIVRYAFEYARAYGRKKVTCFTKDNILKLSDGLFHKVFDEIAPEYPDIINEHWIVDIGAAKLADTPEVFDVVVMPNLYGDILSDVAAQIAGSVGLAGSANIGPTASMFEAIHGSAPRRAGQDMANPSGLILASILMLNHLNLGDHATTIHNAWLVTIESGIHTYDIYKEGVSKEKVGTAAFAKAVIGNLGKKPAKLKPATYAKQEMVSYVEKIPPTKQETVGVDVFVEWKGTTEELVKQLQSMHSHPLKLDLIANRGVVVWPSGMAETQTVSSWRCRFMGSEPGQSITRNQVIELLSAMTGSKLLFTATELLCRFDDVDGFTTVR